MGVCTSVMETHCEGNLRHLSRRGARFPWIGSLHPFTTEGVFLVLVVELVMERGGAEGLKHQAKVRSCGVTRHCAISKGTLG